jgi:hypothetical protein
VLRENADPPRSALGGSGRPPSCPLVATVASIPRLRRWQELHKACCSTATRAEAHPGKTKSFSAAIYCALMGLPSLKASPPREAPRRAEALGSARFRCRWEARRPRGCRHRSRKPRCPRQRPTTTSASRPSFVRYHARHVGVAPARVAPRQLEHERWDVARLARAPCPTSLRAVVLPCGKLSNHARIVAGRTMWQCSRVCSMPAGTQSIPPPAAPLLARDGVSLGLSQLARPRARPRKEPRRHGSRERKKPAIGRLHLPVIVRLLGAGEEIRTLDVNLGKVDRPRF